jgi:hypothetical protein
MYILSHRGLWDAPNQKNSLISLEKSFLNNFGCETDLRDFQGNVVISHDPPLQKLISIDQLLKLHLDINNDLPLALNVKADGLQSALKESLSIFKPKNYFVFDMSVPDTVGYIKVGIPFYTRQSDIEKNPVLYDAAAGVWLDSFGPDWLTPNVLENHLKLGKSVCIVSPELHGRDYLQFWTSLLEWDVISEPAVMICTDHPYEAREFFNDKN